MSDNGPIVNTTLSERERAQRYVDAVPPAGQGTRNDELNALAFAVMERFTLSQAEFESVLLGWAARCSPPIGQIEAGKTIASAWNGAHRKGSVGVKRSARYVYTGSDNKPPPVLSSQPFTSTAPAPAVKSKAYDLSAETDLPEPMPDACRAFMLAAFKEGEGIGIAQETLSEETQKGIPKDGGIVLTREAWLEKLEQSGGDPNKIFRTSDRTGAFVRINPISPDGGKFDKDVTAFRHALLEFDKIGIKEQWNLIQQSNVPCAVVLHSGNKSLHAWVKIDAKDRAEYDARVTALYDHFDAYIERDASGKQADRVRGNKNPSRFSRLPGMVRGKSQQSLIAVHQGCESFLDWMLRNGADDFARYVTVDEMRAFKSFDDPDTLLGRRWICKGGSCLVVGQSGIGKSSLNMQAALTWAIGQSFFGITPKRKLKSLIVQAENDLGDLSEMYRGIASALTRGDDEAYDQIEPDFKANCTWATVSDRVGGEFLSGLAVLIDKHKPDLVWLDPLLAFVGDDIAKQSVCSNFLRVGLAKISKQTGVAWMLIHHTGKPVQDKKAQKDLTHTDFAYMGFGSSELVNWSRAVCVLRDLGNNRYNLKLAKRGERAQAKDLNGVWTVDLTLKHAEQGIHWEQIDDDGETAKYTVNKNKAPGRPKQYVASPELVAKLRAQPSSYTELKKWIMEHEDCGKSTAAKIISQLLEAGKISKVGELYSVPEITASNESKN